MDLNAPRKAYLDAADQPANITPNIPKEDKVKVYSTPMEKSERAKPSPNGITAHKNLFLFKFYIKNK